MELQTYYPFIFAYSRSTHMECSTKWGSHVDMEPETKNSPAPLGLLSLGRTPRPVRINHNCISKEEKYLSERPLKQNVRQDRV